MIYNLQALRALAALLVVLFHMRLLAPINETISWSFAQCGVDIFFVLSGFIMARIGAREAPLLFATRRAMRIIPLYWALTVIVFAAAQLYPSILSAGAPTLSELAGSLFFIPYANSIGGVHPIVHVGWTLNFEVYFYAIFGFCLWVSPRAPIRMASLILAGAHIAGLFMAPQSPIADTYTNSLLLEFVVGMWIALANKDVIRPPPLVGVSAIVLMLALIAASDYWWPEAPRVLKWGAPAAIAVFAAVGLETTARITSPLVLLLGDASYALYLLHTFVIEIAARIIPYDAHAPLWLQLVLNGAVLVATIFAAIAAHVLFERPLSARLKEMAAPNRREGCEAEVSPRPQKARPPDSPP